jgi:hypothetical protein
MEWERGRKVEVYMLESGRGEGRRDKGTDVRSREYIPWLRGLMVFTEFSNAIG